MGVAKIMCNIGHGDDAQKCKVYGWLEVADWCESLLLHLSFSWSVLKKKCLCLIYEFRRNCVCKVYKISDAVASPKVWKSRNTRLQL